jgi:hypothetical protein
VGYECTGPGVGVAWLQRLGTRAVIAEKLAAQAGNVQKAVTLL